MSAHRNGNYPPNNQVSDPAFIQPGYADRCDLEVEATVFKRSGSEPLELRNQRLLVPTGDTVSLDIRNNKIHRSDGNNHVLMDKAYKFGLDNHRPGEPAEIRECNCGSILHAEVVIRCNSSSHATWETIGIKAAIKRLDWNIVVEKASRGDPNSPFQEVAIMQYLQRYYLHTNAIEPISDIAEIDTIQRALKSTFDSHVLMPFDIFRDDEFLYIIMPYLDGGDLHDRAIGEDSITEDDARHFLRETIIGMKFLQRAGICHRDLSIENILTDSRRKIAVFDFGTSLKIPLRDSETNTSQNYLDHREHKRCLIKGQRFSAKVSPPYLHLVGQYHV
jgi:serine/threonine protein kinase